MIHDSLLSLPIMSFNRPLIYSRPPMNFYLSYFFTCFSETLRFAVLEIRSPEIFSVLFLDHCFLHLLTITNGKETS